jgi:hypothetical protein
MKDDIPLAPDTSWGTEVRRLMREQGQKFDGAFAQVIEKYFNRGRAEPLADLLMRGTVEPGEPALRFLAATINPANASSSGVKIRYRLGFTRNRGRARPKKDDAERRARLAIAILDVGAAAMASGNKPDKRFWNCLAGALNENAHWRRQTEFPLKAKLVRIGGGKGREEEPELEIRSPVLASFVQAHIDRRDPYDAAMTLTHDIQPAKFCRRDQGHRQLVIMLKRGINH